MERTVDPCPEEVKVFALISLRIKSSGPARRKSSRSFEVTHPLMPGSSPWEKVVPGIKKVATAKPHKTAQYRIRLRIVAFMMAPSLCLIKIELVSFRLNQAFPFFIDG
jgi:hypothetical protein